LSEHAHIEFSYPLNNTVFMREARFYTLALNGSNANSAIVTFQNSDGRTIAGFGEFLGHHASYLLSFPVCQGNDTGAGTAERDSQEVFVRFEAENSIQSGN
jgi:hypothetical protein